MRHLGRERNQRILEIEKAILSSNENKQKLRN